jgi:hypothetical protein
MIMPDVPAPPFVVSSSTCWFMSRAGEIKATLNPEPVNAYKNSFIFVPFVVKKHDQEPQVMTIQGIIY